MKVLLQHPHAPGAISGVVTYCIAARAVLELAGVETRIFSTHDATSRELWRAVRGVDLVHLNSNHLRLVIFARLQRRPVIIKYHFPLWDEVTVRDYTPQSLARRLGRETLFCWRESAADGIGVRRLRFVGARAVRAVLRVAMAWTVDARLACSEFVARTADLPWPVEVDYNPIPAGMEGPGEDDSTGKGFIFAGRLDATKGVDVLLEAAALLAARGRKLSLEIVGDGPERAKLGARVAQLGLEAMVTFSGPLGPDEVRRRVRRASAIVVPSIWNDAAPYVIVEAATLGRICIGSRRGGIPELTGPAGLLFEAGDAAGLAAHMETLLLRPEEAVARGRAAREHVLALCAAAAAARRLVKIYQRVLTAGMRDEIDKSGTSRL